MNRNMFPIAHQRMMFFGTRSQNLKKSIKSCQTKQKTNQKIQIAMENHAEKQNLISKDEEIPIIPLRLMIVGIVCTPVMGLIFFVIVFNKWYNSPLQQERKISTVCLVLFIIECCLSSVMLFLFGIPLALLCCPLLWSCLCLAACVGTVVFVPFLFFLGTIAFLPCGIVIFCFCGIGCGMLYLLYLFVFFKRV